MKEELTSGVREPDTDPEPASATQTTSWVLIRQAAHRTADGKAAMDALFRRYRPAAYAFIRRRVHGDEEAEDLIQGFFANVLRRNDLAAVDPALGRFRAWLFKALKNHLIDHLRKPRPEEPFVDDVDAPDSMRPDRMYDRSFTLALLDNVLETLRSRYVARGDEETFEALKGRLTGDIDERSYREAADRLGVQENAVRKRAMHLRERYETTLRAKVRELVGGREGRDPTTVEAEVDDEIQYLLQSLEDPEEPRS